MNKYLVYQGISTEDGELSWFVMYPDGSVAALLVLEDDEAEVIVQGVNWFGHTYGREEFDTAIDVVLIGEYYV